MARGAGKNGWALFLLILAGVMLGSLIGHLTSNIGALSWLDYGTSFGLKSPVTLDLGIMVLTFGLTIKFSVASLIGILIGHHISFYLRKRTGFPSFFTVLWRLPSGNKYSRRNSGCKDHILLTARCFFYIRFFS